eukprot:TRINITY_DN13079_c0_g1_i2.p2 TRINITY_DN13079_c0_g1~~TRINITY_DN13079_c0_g1_i2.p2  ORF type:complete len:525 (-),score=98.41 TRINITY_DN13079_c0_g1_i2:1867-3441(-)
MSSAVWDSVVGSLEFFLTITVVVLGIILLRRHWNTPQVVARGRLLTCIVLFGSSLVPLVFSGALLFGTEFMQFALDYSLIMALSFIGCPYLLKAYQLLFKHEISAYIDHRTCLDRSSSSLKNSNHHDDRTNWFMRNKWILDSPVPILAVFGCVSAFIMSTKVLSSAINAPVIMFREFVFYTAYCVLLLLLGSYLCVRLSKFKADKWGIRQELRRLLVQTAGLIVLWQVWMFAWKQTHKAELLYYFLVWLLYFSLHLSSITYPLVQAEITKKSMLLTSNSCSKVRRLPHMIRLQAYLENPQCAEAFRKHLQAEFAVENLSFWIAVQRFNKLTSQKLKVLDFEEVFNMIHYIYQEYVSIFGPSCVNLSHPVRERITSEYKKLCQTLGKDIEIQVRATAGRNTLKGLQAWGAGGEEEEVVPGPSGSRFSASDSGTTVEQRDSQGAFLVTRQHTDDEKAAILDSVLTIYDEASMEILVMMEKDSFSRFVLTQEFKETTKTFTTTLTQVRVFEELEEDNAQAMTELPSW